MPATRPPRRPSSPFRATGSTRPSGSTGPARPAGLSGSPPPGRRPPPATAPFRARPIQTIRLAPPPRVTDPRPALDYIRRSSLFELAQRMMALETDLLQIQPSLKLKPVKLDRQVLIVTAPSAAVGARLRQFEPSLLAGLRARGWLVNRLRFRAQMAAAPATTAATRTGGPGRPGAGAGQAGAGQPGAARVKPPIGRGSIAALERLYRDTVARDGENAPLALTLAGFIARQRGYLANQG